MTWIKDANKLGYYTTTYKGFRIYKTKPSGWMQYYEDRPDGKYRITEFYNGEFTAIDKSKCVIIKPTLSEVSFFIDIELFRRKCEKREGVEIILK